MHAVVEAYGREGGLEVSTQFTIEVRGRSGRLWQYSSGLGVGPLDPGVGDLAQWFDFWARDRFGELLADLYRDGFDGASPPAGYEIIWEITDAARDTQRRCDATPLCQRPPEPAPIRLRTPELGWTTEPIITRDRKAMPGGSY